jgi:diguanylate cyclase (GGDEF)-like protein
VNKFYDTLRGWRSAWHQPATYFGMAMIAAIWVSSTYHLAVERDRLEHGAVKNTSNLARVFEEHIVRIFNETDSTLQLVRTAYLANPSELEFAKQLTNHDLRTNFISHIAVIDAKGMFAVSSLGPVTSIVDVSDRPYFRVQRAASTDEIYIGEPTLGRVVGKQVIQISRGIWAADNSFEGVVLATIDSDYLAKFYKSIDVGKDGAIVLVGFDGIVRASAGFRGDIVGNSLKRTQLFSQIKVSDTGSFLTAGNMDAVKRFVSYRVVKEYPLIVYAGEAEHEVLASYWRNRSWYYSIASVATVLIVIVVIFAIRYRKNLNTAREAMQESEARARRKSHELEVTLEHMDQGIVMIDANRDVVVVNRRLVELLGLPQTLLARLPQGVKVDEALAHLWAAGEYGKEGSAVDPKIRDVVLAGGMSAEIPVYERTRPNGVTLEVHAMALPDGGIVRTFTDVSERKRKELQINHMARHDQLTGLANRALFNERLESALSRLRRQREGFAVLYLDLDRFKSVNDAHGHAVGDALLRAVAGRLSDSVRETDTVARLGGDEFAVLLSAAAGENDAEVLANRIIKSVGAPYDLGGISASIGTSIGIAMAPADGTTAQRMVDNADVALYRAKGGGGNAYRFFGQSDPMRSVPKKSLSIVP